MSEPIKNRYDFVILFDVENGNPNGDPDAGNMPRIDPETGHGLVTDVCLKRKIRNYVETAKGDAEGYRIYIKDQVPLNRSDSEALKYLGVTGDLKAAKKADPDLDAKIRDFMCRNFYDIRTFGAVMTTFLKVVIHNVVQQKSSRENGFLLMIVYTAQKILLFLSVFAVAPHAGSVDRNLPCSSRFLLTVCRSPRGERG